MPECSVHLTQAVVYLSLVPKSNALYLAYERAKKDALTQLAEPVPLVIRNGVTKLMQELDYGKGYQYAHDAPDKLTDMQCLPDSLLGRRYYRPTDQGQEGKFKTRLEQILAWKEQQRAGEETMRESVRPRLCRRCRGRGRGYFRSPRWSGGWARRGASPCRGVLWVPRSPLRRSLR